MHLSIRIILWTSLLTSLYGTVESATVNATLPSSTAILNGTKIDFVLDAFDPAPPSRYYTLMKFGYKKTGVAFARLYSYNEFTSRFVLDSSIPAEFVGRLTTSTAGSIHMVSISPILFTDENYQFYFELDYAKQPSGDPAKVDSQKYDLQNVYSLPTFNDTESMQASTTLIEGRNGTIQCVVSSRPVSTVTWSYNNATINATQSSTTSTSGSIIKVTSVLRISNPSSSLDGEKVTCFASHQFSAAVNRTTIINVQYRPKNTSFSVVPAMLKLNQNITLTCSAVGKPSVTKYRFYVNDKSIGSSTSGSLTVNASDCTRYNGNYKCVPESSIGDGEVKTQSVVVTDDIKVNPRTSALVANETQNITLTCDVSGCPLPTTQWQKNGNPLNRFGSSLKLSSVSKSDSGQYSCHAENGYTNASAQIQVTVNYKPVSTAFTASVAKPTEGSAVSFNCSSDSYPAATYRFYRVDNSGNVLVSSSGSENSGVYTISSVSYSGAYNVTYKCVPYNLLGNGSAVTTTIEIQVRPRIMVSAIPSAVNETQTAVIQCKVLAANPVPSLAITNANGLSITHTNGNATLSSVTADQAGMYTCTASNGIGQPVTGNTTLTVNHIPDKINLTSSNNKPVNGSSVTLTCSARGTPEPQYRFYDGLTNSIVQDSSSGTYITGPLNYEIVTNYSAIFRCIPHNMMGNGVTTSIALDIQVPPKISLSITPQNVNETGNANIACVVAAANPTPVITILNPMNRTVSHTNGAAALTNLSRNDAGIYSCSANNSVPGSPVTKTATLSVNHAPDQPRITATATKPVTGSAVTLTCSARATPAAHFRFLSGNGSVLQDGASANFVIGSLNYVDFTNYTATYGCIAYNSYGEAPRQEIVLDIQVPPVISFSINPSTVNETHNATMQCTVTAANPAPSITIQNPKGQNLSHTDGLVQLDLITREHGGTYSCIASNGVVGSPVTRTAILTVNHRPDNVSISVSSLKPVNGSSVTFTCSSRAGPPAKYRFYKVTGSTEILLRDSTSAVYEITNINYAEYIGYKATVKCIPYNSFGDGPSRNETVDIQVSPQINVPSTLNVNEGQRASLTCSVTAANPSPTITWRGPANNVLSSTNGVLVMSPVRREQNGTYTCEASNGVGSTASKTAALTVYYGPEFTSNSSSLTTCRPRTGIVRCVADGFPVPTVRVMFSNTEKARGQGQVIHIITDLADSTFGVYTCLANNTVKEVNITRTLVKKDAPDALTDVKLKQGSDSSIEVTWRLPVCTGASGIKAIRIKYKKTGESTWKTKDVQSSDTKATIDKLESNTEYEVQVFIVDGNDREHAGLQSSQRTGTTSGSTGESNAGLVGGIIGGVLFLVIVIVVCVAFSKRRRSASTAEYSSNGYRGDTAKSDIPLTGVNGDGKSHYRAPDGSLYASVSKKTKSDQIDGAVDNPKFVADSDGAYDPVVPNNNATPKQSPAANKKAEGTYAELSTFSPKDNGKTKEQPVKTEYATLEEIGPLTPFDKPAEAEEEAKSNEDPPSHKITVAPETEDVPEPEVTVTPPPSDDSSAKVDII
ncbi:hemicentin-2-like isoform X2 [Rhopilema esculentum]|uniref:hemicentin-2-like isoform X2 n=1 Tax=Rhopilema esculentum TaxID=499914 RepID=UPI0031E105DA